MAENNGQPSRLHSFFIKVLGSTTILMVFLVLGVLAAAVFAGQKVYTKLDRLTQQQDTLALDVKLLHQQSKIREIVERKGTKLSPDQRSRIAFEIYDTCRRHEDFPVYLVLGVIEKESNWDPNVSNGNAVGLMQVCPGTAMAHFRNLGIPFSKESLWDPVTNVTVGLRILLDCQDAAVLMGRCPRGQYLRGLFDYNGGGEPYARLVMALAAPYQQELDAPLKEPKKS